MCLDPPRVGKTVRLSNKTPIIRESWWSRKKMSCFKWSPKRTASEEIVYQENKKRVAQESGKRLGESESEGPVTRRKRRCVNHEKQWIRRARRRDLKTSFCYQNLTLVASALFEVIICLDCAQLQRLDGSQSPTLPCGGDALKQINSILFFLYCEILSRKYQPPSCWNSDVLGSMRL